MSEAWPRPPRPSVESVREREALNDAVAANDAAEVRSRVSNDDPRVRASAYRGLTVLDALDDELRDLGCRDEAFTVRRTLAELAAVDDKIDLTSLLGDREWSVVETACWAAGERGATGEVLVSVLTAISAEHEEALCREAAVAALGAIGSEAGLPAILAATRDRATVRRRAVIALAPFDSDEVSAALERALVDRDWQVRQAAEDLSET